MEELDVEFKFGLSSAESPDAGLSVGQSGNCDVDLAFFIGDEGGGKAPKSQYSCEVDPVTRVLHPLCDTAGIHDSAAGIATALSSQLTAIFSCKLQQRTALLTALRTWEHFCCRQCCSTVEIK